MSELVVQILLAIDMSRCIITLNNSIDDYDNFKGLLSFLIVLNVMIWLHILHNHILVNIRLELY